MKLSYSALCSIYRGTDPFELSEALKSLSCQSILPAETIVVLDGPVSKLCLRFLEEFRLSLNIYILKFSFNRGLPYALNHGLSVIRHPFVLRFDTDDINVAERAELLLHELIHSSLDLVGSFVAESEEPSRSVFTGLSIREVPLRHVDILRSFPWRNPFNHPSVLFRVEAVRSVGGYPCLPHLEDYALWSLLAAKGYRLGNISKVLVVMRSTGQIGRRKLVSSQSLKELKMLIREIEGTNLFLLDFLFAVRGLLSSLPSYWFALLYKIFLRKRL